MTDLVMELRNLVATRCATWSSMVKLAEQCDCNVTTIRNFKIGACIVRFDLALSIYKALGLELKVEQDLIPRINRKTIIVKDSDAFAELRACVIGDSKAMKEAADELEAKAGLG